VSVPQILGRISEAILNPLIVIFFAIALIVFFWGIFQFILHNDDEAEREKGKKSMVWGLVGIFVMFAVYGIVNFILSSLGIDAGYPFGP
jgi:hypothetical protein